MNLIYITLLPDDLKILIWDKYIKFLNKVWVNKENYFKYHKLIILKIKKNSKNFDNYIRDIIRLDYYYVFYFLLNDEFINWINKNRIIKYQNILFRNYINYINFLVNKYQSGKIKNLMLKKLKENKLDKIWQENYIITKKKWIGI